MARQSLCVVIRSLMTHFPATTFPIPPPTLLAMLLPHCPSRPPLLSLLAAFGSPSRIPTRQNHPLYIIGSNRVLFNHDNSTEVPVAHRLNNNSISTPRPTHPPLHSTIHQSNSAMWSSHLPLSRKNPVTCETNATLSTPTLSLFLASGHVCRHHRATFPPPFRNQDSKWQAHETAK
ncbi:hypothetical protein BD410DRAFT_41211 [Rickenella mellea]|uniref:Uncharacterized protein n=1 Tax=Rickenella mellea TaxID=50990 RepID=A0A4R5XGN9_9AGAM|nr:hypothetical protein BD410DRAFT_41211 [Rickenella mellea]